ncbi:50S ribosomal protein L11 methyltransferase [Sphingomonas cavernae]|uniref:Ribosomal protein L11 methyltransferase n=1 Tax=Sphingomonas cavernae TaxID=2320861 RepID=A0A418WKQ9_9SPHN|nr:50S ribosomal protein L11 methyltransferase [Sphingomonas cavernae]RJF90419.1 50S ribosomal protein L11 methyltransferase [Sphingomonas cavernae]
MSAKHTPEKVETGFSSGDASTGESWKLTLPCTAQEARILEEDIGLLAELDPLPVLMTSEPDPARPEQWQLDAYFENKPDDVTIALITALIPSAAGVTPKIEKVEQADWVTLSQAGLEPVRAGRFFVHTSTNADNIPVNAKPFLIEAGLAFGTGQHETTTGCLMMLDRLKREGNLYRDLIDVGTGTGLLAFAAMHLWPRAFATASDIDPISIDVTRENAEINDIPLGTREGRLALVVAEGMQHRTIQRRAPYDLIIANILAGPLIEMAPSIAAVLEEGGTLILAGLLDSQAHRVATAYRRQGLRLAGRIDRGEWPTLMLRKRRRFG